MKDPLILLIEDHEDNRNIYRTILEHSGFRVLLASDGREGLRLAREGTPDLILMDISIPHIDGWEVTRILKEEPGTASIPIIALTAHALAEDRARAGEVGCDGFLTKPVEPRRVIEVVRGFLDGTPREVPGVAL